MRGAHAHARADARGCARMKLAAADELRAHAAEFLLASEQLVH